MTETEIREAYLKSIEQDIVNAQTTCANDPYFDKLMNLCNSSYGYRLFYNLATFRSNSTGSDKICFYSLCELYSLIRYCWEDDGEISIVSAKCKYGRHKGNFNEIFVITGERNNLCDKDVANTALFHDSNDSKLISYTATIFSKEFLDFLVDMIPEFERVAKLGSYKSAEWEDVENYFKENDKIKQTIMERIEMCKYKFRKKLSKTIMKNGY
jgi:hypothetical protein